MAEIKRNIKVKLNLSDADRACVDQILHVYPTACNYVSKYAYKHHIISQSRLLKDLQTTLRERYGLSRSLARSVIKTVADDYKGQNHKKKWKRIRYNRKTQVFHWKIDYVLTDEEFCLNILPRKWKCKIVDFDKYFYLTDCFCFEDAKIIKGINSYYMKIPVLIINEDMGKVEKILTELVVSVLWFRIEKKMFKAEELNS